MRSVTQNSFKYGNLSSIDADNIPREASSGSLNWLTEGQRISLRRGLYRLGITEVTGVGKITGGIVGKRADGVEIPFVSYGRKVAYYDVTTDEWIEIGTDVLPSGTENDIVTFTSITTPAGPQVWLNSPHAGLHKIMVANPDSITAMYDGAKNYRGYCTVKNGGIWMWNISVDGKVPDYVNVYRSYLATKATADFTQISAEAIGGAGITRTGTLAFKAAGTTRTCLEVTFTDGTETFIDDLSGNLVGSAGGTGTINYTTGAYSVTFAVAPGAPVTSTYRWEDSNVAGLSDFTFSSTRTSGQGLVLRQGDGGSPMMNVFNYNNTYYCFHKNVTWQVTISSDDLTVSNTIYRHKVGIPSIFGACETGEGIYYIDDIDENDPQIRILTLDALGTLVLPQSVSKKFKLEGEKVGVDLTAYNYDETFFMEFGNIILVTCKKGTSNDSLLHINKDSGAIDELGYIYAQILNVYNSAVIAGSSISNNTNTLFSGLDDQDTEIPNFRISKNDNLDDDKLKTAKRFILDGEIGPDMKIRLYVAPDNGAFVEVLDENGGAFIDGQGSYVDRTQSVNVGAYTLGRGVVGGGGSGISAYHYMRELKLNQERFQKIKWKVVGEGIGWASVSMQAYKDIRQKWNKLPSRYRG